MKPRRHFFAPEIIQTSGMDCGPAALASLGRGLGLRLDYARLREACQTDVDGTSIDTLEQIAVQLGLSAEQVVIPVDQVLSRAVPRLPCIAVVTLANGFTHFVVAWRQVGGFVQVMDPGSGRRWMRAEAFLGLLYRHTQPVPAAGYREWAESESFLAPLRERLASLRATAVGELRIAQALQQSDPVPIARVDAAVRFVAHLRSAGALRPGRETSAALEHVIDAAVAGEEAAIPAPFWSAVSLANEDGSEARIALRGAVLLTASGLHDEGQSAALPPDLRAALEVTPPSWALVREMFKADGLWRPGAALSALSLAACASAVEALLFRGLFDLGRVLQPARQRIGAMVALLAFLAAFAVLEASVAGLVAGIARRLEARLRVLFLEKLPRLADQYFHSRPISDMASRSHSIHQIRTLLPAVQRLWSGSAELLCTTLGLVWLAPRQAPIALLAGLFSFLLPLTSVWLLAERDRRRREHAGALSRFYLDSLLGLSTVRAHGGERSVRREHEALLVEWGRAGWALARGALTVELCELLLGYGFAAWLLLSSLGAGLAHGEVRGFDPSLDAGRALLLVYWTLNLPTLGSELAQTARQLPGLRNIMERLLEPLGVHVGRAPLEASEPAAPLQRSLAAHVCFDRVSVVAGGHPILEEIDLELRPGDHLAVVGPSGAGKSTLVGLLLGWFRAENGALRVDGAALEGIALDRLRQQTAWVDPAMQLWNRSLLANLAYGASRAALDGLSETMDAAELGEVLEQLPEGLQTSLGEAGGLLSGGEGQRVRLGRALLRRDARLVILDEPFRGLDRERRRALLARARSIWSRATLLYVTHDVADTRSFPRVAVVEHGRLAELGPPERLLAGPSRYRGLCEADEGLGALAWHRTGWRRLTLDGGVLSEEPS